MIFDTEDIKYKQQNGYVKQEIIKYREQKEEAMKKNNDKFIEEYLKSNQIKKYNAYGELVDE